jgi:hypothetical protein
MTILQYGVLCNGVIFTANKFLQELAMTRIPKHEQDEIKRKVSLLMLVQGLS